MLDVQFGLGGNGVLHQNLGWSDPEDGFTWSVNSETRLSLPISFDEGVYLLILSGFPFRAPPVIRSQTVEVWIDSVRIGSRIFFDAFEWGILLPRLDRNRESFSIRLRHPDCAQPSVFGRNDFRFLGVAYRKIKIVKVDRTPSDEEGIAPPIAGSIRVRKPLRSRVSNKDYIRTVTIDAAIEELIFNMLRAARVASASEAVRSYFRTDAVEIEIESGIDPSLLRCVFSKLGFLTVTFQSAVNEAEHAEGLRMVVWHFLELLPLLLRYCCSGKIAGECTFNLGDEAHVPGVAFCSNAPSIFLIPDPHFLRTKGYDGLKADLRNTPIHWGERRNVAVWRGSTTGYRTKDDIRSLERVRFCEFAQLPENCCLIDAGFSSFSQLRSERERDTLKELRLEKDFIPFRRFQEWKFQIDIDGNTNAWPGLFQKLLSNSVVFKITSQAGWRQWYYDQLRPYENYVPVEPDFSDLIDKIEFYIRNDSAAKRIASAGHALATSLTYESQVTVALSTIEECLIAQAVGGP